MKQNRGYLAAEISKKPIFTFKNADFEAIARAVVNKGIPFKFMAKGISMFPFIKPNDIITIFPADPSRLDVGDIICFAHPEMKRPLIHRIIKKRDSSFIASGDNNFKNDGLVSNDCIIGHVKKVERGEDCIRIGMGPEKYVIAILNRTKAMYLIIRLMIQTSHFIKKVFV